MSEPNLKPCPFCGGEASTRPRRDHWRLDCADCPVAIEMQTSGDCAEAWNRRVPADHINARLLKGYRPEELAE